MARPTTAARRYAEAAFQVAEREDAFAAWRARLDAAARVLADERLMAGLRNPATPVEQREKLLDAVLEGIDAAGADDARVPDAGAGTSPGASAGTGPGTAPLVRNLCLLLLHRGRIDLLPNVAAEFRRLDDARQGIVPAAATSASPLGPDEVRALTARLEQLTGGRVALDLQVDPSIIGGLIVRVGDRLIDGSVRGRLERLRSRLVSGAL